MKTKRISILQAFLWVIRSRVGFLYKSEKDAQMYDLMARRFFGRERLAKKIAEYFQKFIKIDPAKTLICDCAAGTGIIAEALIEKGYNLTALDISRAQLNQLSLNFPQIQTALYDLNEEMTGLKDNSFNGLVQVGAGRFLTPIGQKIFAKEAKRVLKKGGILIWPVFISECVGKITQGIKWKASPHAIEGLLKDVGFRILKKELHLNFWTWFFACKIIIAQK